MAINKIVKNSLGADAIDATKIADNSISEEHIDVTAITGHTTLSASADPDDVLLIYDTDAGVIKKITAGNVGLQAPTISGISPTSVLQGDGTGNFTFTITGTNFVTGSTAVLITNGGSTVQFDTVTRNSSTQITAVIAKTSLTDANEPYDVKVTTPQNLTVTLENQINVDQSPVFVTASGSLGTIGDAARSGISKSVNATDPDSAGNVTFEIQSGSLPAGLTLTNTAAEGGTAIIGGTATAVGSDTTSNFVLRAVDAASNTSSRAFSMTILAPSVEVFNASGTFAVPAGVSTVDVLVVAGGGSGGRGTAGNTAGGGGGAGGLIFMPSYPVTPGGTITVTVGCGDGTTADGSSPGQPAASDVGQDSVFGTLTAKGGGGGGNENAQATNGGSGGGAGGGGNHSGNGAATQPTQPGNSGAYGHGNAGAQGLSPGGAVNTGGGGGAGASGGTSPGSAGGQGGVGRAYSIADGTTPVYYAGGGGGGGEPGNCTGGSGGQGGGGDGGDGNSVGAPGSRVGGGNVGTANRGGGGGGGGRAGSPCGGPGGGGGKGVVIVRWTA
jgi:hypothetical protein